jgi:hypothetical protein
VSGDSLKLSGKLSRMGKFSQEASLRRLPCLAENVDGRFWQWLGRIFHRTTSPLKLFPRVEYSKFRELHL